ncbi:MAG: hypothetical protein H7222_08025 [Methylotenera sp.]|nr:hypothetical protein [Oligoflexia bacterium]
MGPTKRTPAPIISNSARLALSLAAFTSVLFSAVNARNGFAFPGEPPHAARTVCAVLEKFEGEVQILNSDRSELIDTQPESTVACGNWISVGQGWAIIRHAQGYRFHAGNETFIQIQDLQAADNAEHDHLLLFKGQLSAYAGKGMGELHVASANGRARITNGTGVLIFDSEKVETQLIALDQPISLENRFFATTATSRITLRAGEASVLKLSSARLIPSTPKALAISALRSKLQELQLGESFQDSVTAVAQKRADRKLASELKIKTPHLEKLQEKTETVPQPALSSASGSSGLELQPPVVAEIAPAFEVGVTPAPVVAPAPGSRSPASAGLQRHLANKLQGDDSDASEDAEITSVSHSHANAGKVKASRKIPRSRSQIRVRSRRSANQSDSSAKPGRTSGEPEKAHLLQELGEIQPD